MARRVYTAENKATVFAALTANEGNVKRTTRETDIPEQTVRDWKKLWARTGVPAVIADAILPALEEKAEQYERVRDKALDIALDRLDDPKTSAKDATWIAGVMTDKIRLLRGEATSRTEHVSTGPTPEEVGEQIAHYLEQAVRAQELREADIVDGEYTEQAALPSGEATEL